MGTTAVRLSGSGSFLEMDRISFSCNNILEELPTQGIVTCGSDGMFDIDPITETCVQTRKFCNNYVGLRRFCSKFKMCNVTHLRKTLCKPPNAVECASNLVFYSDLNFKPNKNGKAYRRSTASDLIVIPVRKSIIASLETCSGKLRLTSCCGFTSCNSALRLFMIIKTNLNFEDKS